MNEVKKVNKSELIVAAFRSEGLDTPANDLIKYIKESTGVDVTVSLVNNIRHKARRRKAARRQKVQPVDPLSRLFEVKEFATKVGGLDALKELVSKLEALAA